MPCEETQAMLSTVCCLTWARSGMSSCALEMPILLLMRAMSSSMPLELHVTGLPVASELANALAAHLAAATCRAAGAPQCHQSAVCDQVPP